MRILDRCFFVSSRISGRFEPIQGFALQVSFASPLCPYFDIQYLRLKTMKTMNYFRSLMFLFALFFASPNLLPADLYSAQIAVGYHGKLSARTEIGLMNRSDQDQSVKVSFFTPQGLPFQVRLINPGVGASEGSEFQLQVPSQGNLNLTATYCLNAGGNCQPYLLQAGYARFEVDDIESVEIETVFINTATETAKTATAAAVSVGPPGQNWFFNSRISESYFLLTGRKIRIDSGLALINPNESGINVEVTLFNPDGSQRDSITFQMNPGQQVARFITELFPDLISSLSSGFGSFRVGIQASLPVALIALRADVSDDFLISGVPVFVAN